MGWGQACPTATLEGRCAAHCCLGNWEGSSRAGFPHLDTGSSSCLVQAAASPPMGGLLPLSPAVLTVPEMRGSEAWRQAHPDRCSAAGRESIDPLDTSPGSPVDVTSLRQSLGRVLTFSKPNSSANGTNSH